MKETIYKRIFVIVLDSLGIGAMPDSEKFGDRDVAVSYTHLTLPTKA